MGAESFEPVIVAGEHLVELRGGACPPAARPAIEFAAARPSAASAAEDERQVGSQVGASEARGARLDPGPLFTLHAKNAGEAWGGGMASRDTDDRTH